MSCNVCLLLQEELTIDIGESIKDG